jgi:hypothetical protein
MSVCDIETTLVAKSGTNVISTTVWVVETTLVDARKGGDRAAA